MAGTPGVPDYGGRRQLYVDRMDSSDIMERMSANSEGGGLGSGRASPMPPVTPEAQSKLSEFRDKHARAMEVLKKAASSARATPKSSRPGSEAGFSQGPPRQQVQEEPPAARLSTASVTSDVSAGASSAINAAAAQAVQVQAAPVAVVVAEPIRQQSGPPPHAHSDPYLRVPGAAAAARQTSAGTSTPGGTPAVQVQTISQEAALSKIVNDIRERQLAMNEKVSERLAELQQESKGQLAELQVMLEAQAKELSSTLQAQQSAGSQLGDLRSLLEVQAREIDSLRSQELHIGVRAIKESVATFDKMGGRRAQELQLSLGELQDLVAAQARELQEIRAAEVPTSLGAVKETLEQQCQALMDVGPQTQELHKALAVVRENIEAQSSRLVELRVQARDQHQERLEEMRRLRAGVSLQQEGLMGELDAHRQQLGQQEAAARSWQLERKQLQEEVARLASLPPGFSRQATGEASPMGGRTSQRQATTLALVAAASAGLTAVMLLLRPRGGEAPEAVRPGQQQHHFGPTFCAPAAAARLRAVPRPPRLELPGLPPAHRVEWLWRPLGSIARRSRRHGA